MCEDKKPICQTKMTKEVLAKIEAVSRVKWNGGELPTEYWDDEAEDLYLNISEDAFAVHCQLVDAKSLYLDIQKESRTQCTAEEFVEHCKAMLPRD
jgi:hypothetical protein